jgi:hypothetical protein
MGGLTPRSLEFPTRPIEPHVTERAKLCPIGGLTENDMAILDLASHPFAYVTVAELSNYWRLSRDRVLDHVVAGHLEAIELGPGIYRVRVSTALAFERQSLVNAPRHASLVAWPWPPHAPKSGERHAEAACEEASLVDPVPSAGVEG